MESHSVSVIVINHNGIQFLGKCLQSILASEYPDFEIIIVDNASSDNSANFLLSASSQTSKLRIILNSKNLGPAAARNQAASIAKGAILAFLDNDTRPDRKWLTYGCRSLEDHQVGAVQCKLLLDDGSNRIDSIGSLLSKLGFLIQRVPLGVIEDKGQYDHPTDIFCTKSAGMIVRRTAFEVVGRFDEDYFIFNEEMDVCWRLWLAGYRVVFVPTSKVYHRSGSTQITSPESIEFLLYFHGTKNYIASNIKNQPDLAVAFLHACVWVGIGMSSILISRATRGLHILKAVIWAMRNLKALLGRRTRVVSNLPDRLVRPFDLRYYISTFKRYSR